MVLAFEAVFDKLKSRCGLQESSRCSLDIVDTKSSHDCRQVWASSSIESIQGYLHYQKISDMLTELISETHLIFLSCSGQSDRAAGRKLEP